DVAEMLDLAQLAGVEAARARLLGGEIVNRSERRPAMHVALRAPEGAGLKADGADISSEVGATRAAMRCFAEAVRSGQVKGAAGKPFRSLLHIGIGGSDLGPRLVWEALKPLEPQIELRFVANVDAAELAQ